MGGQACILYGAAEFSRDVDLAVAVSPDNFARLRRALADLRAVSVFFPPLSAGVLQRGHACHFRCLAPRMEGLRVDVIAVMRGVAPFGALWERRQVIRLPGVGSVNVMSLADLVQAKKTQRDKDWPMVRRLIEGDIARSAGPSTPSRRSFWLRECRTPELLCDLVRRYPGAARRIARERAAVAVAIRGRARDVERALDAEQARERHQDRLYWKPLRAELERWPMERPRPGSRRGR